MKKILLALLIIGINFFLPLAEANEKEDSMKELAKSVQSYVVGLRRHLHANPELRFQEEGTLLYIIEEVNKIFADMVRADKNPGDFFQICDRKGGFTVDYTINPSYDRIIFRADIDAVPVHEETGLPYTSIVPGVSHACGHDTHVAMLLGAMKLIAEGKVAPKHNIRFVFQRAEENPLTESGGAMLVREGVLDIISKAYALHIYTEGKAKAGQFQTRKGKFLANSGRVKISLSCTGGHVSRPHNGSNCSDIVFDIGMGLRNFMINYLGPLEPISFVPASVSSGEPGASNVRPGKAEMWYAFRHYLSPEKATKAKLAIKAKVEAIVSAYPDAKVLMEFFDGHPTLTNDLTTTQSVMDLLTSAGEEVIEIDPVFGGEDFAHYLNKVPGAMVMLGAYQEGSGGHHSKTFNPDESVFWKGVLYWLLLATN